MAERNKLSKAQTFQEQYNIDINSLLVFIVEKSFSFAAKVLETVTMVRKQLNTDRK